MSMVNLANTLLRGPQRAVDVTETPRVASAENAPTTTLGMGSTALSGSVNSRITKAWDDLAEIARDARCSYDNEGLTLAATCLANAARELFTIADLVGQAERNAEPRE